MWVGILAALAAAPALAADNSGIERMATCRDSWFDWQKGDPAQLKLLGAHMRTALRGDASGSFLVPTARMSIAGLRVLQVYPNSVGMGVGFSVLVDATFADAKRTIEKSLGKPLGKCEVSDDMRTCGLQIADKRTVMMMAPDPEKKTGTLVGCYYFYEK